ncbi:hypothetical protein SERLA73DRAFT_179686 [Serpula lacrymans var. lacrymans S7.3]|uniref:Uncharacterized protein n=2 Tax=Serpula lacrymans var. lacrymans TaxID=341189 RepID=F8PTX6_SERL3|nr:uncharacterized protein SERLADRAFT_464909 [Serpula lacrymans var. lacrymans S7.9]EGN99601.1 hypothetical protein SERLA73DRAFT_179686 [Serpula lacrymans var. lacrymans S7.3]EGO25169.1 hypothetical protein SERLADRAFT_464909 [Serpula lacrymans var. lacrymans S7.9]
MSSDEVLSHFGVLDDLIQVIYQGFDRFVILSKVDDSNWTTYVGLKGSGSWWRGSWSAKDILHIAGSGSTLIVLEAFADKLAQAFIQGDLSIGNWASNKVTNLNLIFGAKSKTPLQVPLVELKPQEVAVFASTIFIEIALEAQSRKCRLNPSPFASVSAVSEASHTATAAPVSMSRSRVAAASSPDLESQRRIKTLETELALSKEKKGKSPPNESGSKPSTTAVRPPKGASLANPNKKARKYQALEFESDEE